MAFARLRGWAKALKRDVLALWFACRDPATPLLPKLLASAIVVYALSPIDLIPDFIPILGFVDDMILLPAAIYLVTRLIPGDVMQRARARATQWFEEKHGKPRSYAGAVIILVVWGALLYALWRALAPTLPT